MKRKVPKFRRKVQGIPGDCMLPGLGLSSADKMLLVKNVSSYLVFANRCDDLAAMPNVLFFRCFVCVCAVDTYFENIQQLNWAFSIVYD